MLQWSVDPRWEISVSWSLGQSSSVGKRVRPFSKQLSPGRTLSSLHGLCLGTEPQRPEDRLSKVSHNGMEEKRLNSWKVPERGYDGFVPLKQSVAERLRPSPLCSPFSAKSLGQVRSGAQTPPSWLMAQRSTNHLMYSYRFLRGPLM